MKQPIARPNYADTPTYYHKYLDLSQNETDLILALEKNWQEIETLLKSIPAEKENYRYAPEKWTVKQLIGHIADCERMFAYRIWRFSRFDATELQPFDENHYAAHDRTDARTLAEMIEEFGYLRKSSIALLSYLTDEMLDFKGSVRGNSVTPRGIAWFMLGHGIHHINVLKERYL
ncbi:Uncharacterized damage-inducible protein DinB (forms a four-helix bundle) [Flexibacter flexilis DSM 6793]|uniref:Uncharacterized damage-inducible protein DinB (Forms a four-helix bundle) n=1 Tax=Flexibacter flexilis DSM 6793 TaxID=927664 RepID=A0A1I1HX19_9BACT|nr:DinB family protein [Flexibacter flexilis]SFC28719.1 Uncharacterized damage-inducible protein DinB (forms a four-helix bundle) [Flexibacter flexilis DSM 6793]